MSEGRDAAVLAGLADAVSGAGGELLDVHADPDHHRSVFTFVGGRDTVIAAALALGRVAVGAIDLRRHRGVHPRLGALDVVPFVPLAGARMGDAAAAARAFADAFVAATAVPVFFYGEVAGRAGRRELPELRRGGLAGLAARTGESGWQPDLGPLAPHPSAGVTAVGARSTLIALNGWLDTDDVARARSIARAVREAAPGGLPAVRALGVLLASRGVAQVALNLLDWRQTPPAAAAARVELEARTTGCAVARWELVGCAPAAALAPWPETLAPLGGLHARQLLPPDMLPGGAP